MTEDGARKIHAIDPRSLVQIPLDAEVAYTATPDGLEIKQLYFKEPGTLMGQHAHLWSHAHLVGSGEIRVWVEGVEVGDFKAGECINIEAGKKHMLMSLKADTRGFCIHNTANPIVERAVFPK